MMPARLLLPTVTLLLIWVTLFPAARSTGTEMFRSDSKRFGNAKMDIVLTEIDRQPRTSILEAKITAIATNPCQSATPDRKSTRLNSSHT